MIIKYKGLLARKPYIENVIQTTYWSNTYKDTDEILYIPLKLYNDDFSSGHALSKHNSAYTVSAMYSSIASIPPREASLLDNIYLNLLFFVGDRKRFRNCKVLKNYIDQLNDLMNNGIDIVHHKIKKVELYSS